MPRYSDLTGQHIGQALIICAVPAPLGQPRWAVQCDCGTKFTARQAMINRHRDDFACKSCTWQVAVKKRSTQNGLSRTPEYRIWNAMRQRCYNPKSKSYQDYGQRGIVVVERWHTFDHFLSDMGPRPTPKMTIERMDNNGPYSPDNCRWDTRTSQARNTSHNRLITINGVTKCLVEWVELSGLPYHLVKRRMNRDGWSPSQALFTSIDTTRRAHHPGGRSE